MTLTFSFAAVALKCWTCSSDSVRPNVQNQYCKDPFDAENISDVDKERSYKECIPTADQSHNHNAYCRKLTQTGKWQFFYLVWYTSLTTHENNNNMLSAHSDVIHQYLSISSSEKRYCHFPLMLLQTSKCAKGSMLRRGYRFIY